MQGRDKVSWKVPGDPPFASCCRQCSQEANALRFGRESVLLGIDARIEEIAVLLGSSLPPLTLQRPLPLS